MICQVIFRTPKNSVIVVLNADVATPGAVRTILREYVLGIDKFPPSPVHLIADLMTQRPKTFSLHGTANQNPNATMIVEIKDGYLSLDGHVFRPKDWHPKPVDNKRVLDSRELPAPY